LNRILLLIPEFIQQKYILEKSMNLERHYFNSESLEMKNDQGETNE